MADTTIAPWPIVGECYYPAPSMVMRDHSCSQCDGSHDHEWVAWRGAPRVEGTADTYVIGGASAPGIPVRCKTCGGRKCDTSDCMARRHHRGPHEPF